MARRTITALTGNADRRLAATGRCEGAAGESEREKAKCSGGEEVEGVRFGSLDYSDGLGA